MIENDSLLLKIHPNSSLKVITLTMTILKTNLQIKLLQFQTKVYYDYKCKIQQRMISNTQLVGTVGALKYKPFKVITFIKTQDPNLKIFY